MTVVLILGLLSLTVTTGSIVEYCRPSRVMQLRRDQELVRYACSDWFDHSSSERREIALRRSLPRTISITMMASDYIYYDDGGPSVNGMFTS